MLNNVGNQHQLRQLHFQNNDMQNALFADVASSIDNSVCCGQATSPDLLRRIIFPDVALVTKHRLSVPVGESESPCLLDKTADTGHALKAPSILHSISWMDYGVLRYGKAPEYTTSTIGPSPTRDELSACMFTSTKAERTHGQLPALLQLAGFECMNPLGGNGRLFHCGRVSAGQQRE